MCVSEDYPFEWLKQLHLNNTSECMLFLFLIFICYANFFSEKYFDILNVVINSLISNLSEILHSRI